MKLKLAELFKFLYFYVESTLELNKTLEIYLIQPTSFTIDETGLFHSNGSQCTKIQEKKCYKSKDKLQI